MKLIHFILVASSVTIITRPLSASAQAGWAFMPPIWEDDGRWCPVGARLVPGLMYEDACEPVKGQKPWPL